MTRKTVLSPEAAGDLADIYDYIADRGAPNAGLAFLERIEACCARLADFPLRGTRRDDLRPGLRTVGFEGRVTIVFHLDADTTVIDRLLYGGRDLERVVNPGE